MKIEGAVALVTGGASGIGKALCEKLLQGGTKVRKSFKLSYKRQYNAIIHSVHCENGLKSGILASHVDKETGHGIGHKTFGFNIMVALKTLIISHELSWILNANLFENLRFIYLASKAFILS